MAQSQELGRQIGDRRTPRGNSKAKREEVEPEEWEELPNRRA